MTRSNVPPVAGETPVLAERLKHDMDNKKASHD